jgi:hypothetical protein
MPAHVSTLFWPSQAALVSDPASALSASMLRPGVRYYLADGSRAVRIATNQLHIVGALRSVDDNPVDKVGPLQDLTPSKINHTPGRTQGTPGTDRKRWSPFYHPVGEAHAGGAGDAPDTPARAPTAESDPTSTEDVPPSPPARPAWSGGVPRVEEVEDVVWSGTPELRFDWGGTPVHSHAMIAAESEAADTEEVEVELSPTSRLEVSHAARHSLQYQQ